MSERERERERERGGERERAGEEGERERERDKHMYLTYLELAAAQILLLRGMLSHSMYSMHVCIAKFKHTF